MSTRAGGRTPEQGPRRRLRRPPCLRCVPRWAACATPDRPCRTCRRRIGRDRSRRRCYPGGGGGGGGGGGMLPGGRWRGRRRRGRRRRLLDRERLAEPEDRRSESAVLPHPNRDPI